MDQSARVPIILATIVDSDSTETSSSGLGVTDSSIRLAARPVVCGLVCVTMCWLVIRTHPLNEVDSTYYYDLRYTLFSICVPAMLILLTNKLIANSVRITARMYEHVCDFVSGDDMAFQEMQRDLQSRIDGKNYQRALA